MSERLRQGVFVTGTDTGIGKTVIATGLLRSLQERAYHAVGMKPVASGCERTADGLRNDDAQALIAASSRALRYEDVNPFAYEPAVAPHLAAVEAKRPIQLGVIAEAYAKLAAESDIVVVEGAGGWRVPLNSEHTMADLAARLRLPVVLVVGIRLGCLNHALLSAEAILADDRPLAGWVANLPAREPLAQAQVDTLRERLPAPLLGVVPPLGVPRAQEVASYLDPAPVVRACMRLISEG